VNAGGSAFVALAALWGIAVTIFWMVTAWRAMRAHERLSAAVERLAEPGRPPSVG
jgi:uncharacterized membrane protein